MKITAFEGNKGESILIHGNDGAHILIDGGLVDPYFSHVNSYRDNIAPALARLREEGKALDLVCVSHIDQDHIGGILQMLNDEFQWRVYQYQISQGLEPKEPQSPRPPEIKVIWHNSFHEQINKNYSEISEALAAVAPSMQFLNFENDTHGGEFFNRLGNSMSEAARLSRRIGGKQLGIPLNPHADGKLITKTNMTSKVEFSGLEISVLGPTNKRLYELRRKWNNWLESSKGKKAIDKISKRALKDQDMLANMDLTSLLLESDLGPAIGDRETVTEENIASIILMVEEDGKKVLMTGDARDDHIIDDLIASGFADQDGHVHVDVLKLQHHASENNFSVGFGQLVTADHYLICGNGKHKNPDLRVIDRLLKSRLGRSENRSSNPEVNDYFQIWFTSDGTTNKAELEHMNKVIKLVKSQHSKFPGRFEFHFSSDESLEIEV